MAMCVLQCPFRQRKERVSREDVEHRVREEREKYTEKFSEDARLFCTQVTYCMYMSVGLCVRVLGLFQLLDKDCVSRLGCGADGFSDVQSHPFFQSINWTHLLVGRVTPPFKPSVSHSDSSTPIASLGF